MDGVIFLDQYAGMGGGQVVLVELLRRLSSTVPCLLLAPEGALLAAVREAAPRTGTQPWEPALRRRPLLGLLRAVDGPAAVVVVNGQRALVPAVLVKALRLARGRRTHVVFVAHSRPGSGPRRLVVKVVSRWCDSRLLVARCLEQVVSGPVVTVPLGVRPQDLPDTDVVRPVRSAPRVKAMGRDDPVKGLDLFVLAARRLHGSGRCQGAQFLLALSPGLESTARRGRPDGRTAGVRDVGARTMSWVEPDDLLVVPSRSETACLTAQEAMARGAVVVAAAVGDLPDFVVEGQTGFLFPPGDADALADAVERALLLDVAQRRVLRAAARRAVEERAGPWYDAAVDLMTELAALEVVRA